MPRIKCNKTSKTSKKSKKNKRTLRKITRNNKKKSYKNMKNMKGGLGGLDISTFFDELGKSNENTLKAMLYQSLTSEKDTKNVLEDIIELYKINMDKHLYDFIYTMNENGKYILATLWDHEIGKPESITAGKLGVHIYVIKTNEGEFEIIGKFERKI